ncbi:hemin uptake protein HemP [Planctellipticum variicoloris]|uniref:hemin uptake protein HemP n=1 Tax=Planctellipticum variicoloris TaxID=3064265 RepID=UPI002B767DA2|nr:hemin uptake protein HemP [Planctomycetaceae bacterium SH412]HTN01066.1 hemin uptake protein HemP [Planctomycetaceae bacterium]
MLSEKTSNPPETPEPVRESAVTPPRTVSSDDLFQGGHELLIEHHGEVYRLRLTKTGKLILNK